MEKWRFDEKMSLIWKKAFISNMFDLAFIYVLLRVLKYTQKFSNGYKYTGYAKTTLRISALHGDIKKYSDYSIPYEWWEFQETIIFTRNLVYRYF